MYQLSYRLPLPVLKILYTINPISFILILRFSLKGYEDAFSQSKSQYFVSPISLAAILIL